MNPHTLLFIFVTVNFYLITSRECTRPLPSPDECSGIRSRVDTRPDIPYSEWGTNDEIGALNRLGPHKVYQALRTIKEGKTYQLGYVLSSSSRAFGTRVFRNYVFNADIPSSNGLNYYDDFEYPDYLGVGSQIDTLAHICMNDTCFNRFQRNEMFIPTETVQNVIGIQDGTPIALDGLKYLGADNLLPIVTRGVVLDMPPVFEKPRLEVGDEITCEKIIAALQRQKTTIKPGDVVLIHTGYSEIMDSPAYAQSYPGLTLSGAQLLIEKKVVAVGADTVAIEAVPSTENSNIWPNAIFPVHTLLIPKNGIFILEVMNTDILVKNGITDFMFVLGVTRASGAAQAHANPIAIK